MTAYRRSSFSEVQVLDKLPMTSEDKKNRVKLSFKTSLKEIQFRSGYALVKKQFKWSKEKIEIRIPNAHLISEYEYIKPLFARHFGRKTIDIIAVIDIVGKEVISARGNSAQIDSINPDVIDTIKLKEWKRNIHQPNPGPIDKSLFTFEDLYDNQNSSERGDLTPDNFADLFNTLIKDKSIRNGPQLKYLAGHLHEPKRKVLISLQPNIGFVFYCQGQERVHYIWELLDTHATYIWSFESHLSAKEQEDRLSLIFFLIRNKGRSLYKYSVKHPDDPVLNVVEHRHANSEMVDHFPKWKLKIESLLV